VVSCSLLSSHSFIDVIMVGSSGYLLYFEDDVDYFVELHDLLHFLVYKCKYNILLNSNS
jgi:hypothetical protein